MKEVEAVLVGGSNSVVANGYLANMTNTCRRHGVEVTLKGDFSVGNTTCGYGLFRLKKAANSVKSAQAIIIEYALNDEFIYALHMWNLRHWARLYEGIIRFARELNPEITVYSIILAARNGHFTDRIPAISSGIQYLSSWHGADYVDVNRQAAIKFGQTVVRNEQFYMPGNSAHYLNPTVTSAIGEIVGDGLIRALENRRGSSWVSPSTPIDLDNFASASAVDMAKWAESRGETPVRHQNWRFTIDSIDLATRKLRINLEDGKLLGLEYACVRDTGPLHVEYNGQCFRVGTMKSGVQSGTYKFLISWLPLEFIYQGSLLTGDRGSSSIVISGRAGSHQTEIPFTPRDGVQREREELSEVNSFHLAGFLHTGRCVSIEYI